MDISASLVKQLREQTGAPMMDCKKALLESGGDFEKAVTYLRQKSLATVTKKTSRPTSDGLIAAYIHPGSKIGVMVELNCETDFVARGDDFTVFTKNVAMHIAALNPIYVRREDVSEPVIESEKSIYREQAKESGKPEKFWDKIISGRLEKFYAEVCLLEQSFVKDPNKTIRDLLNEKIAKLGENMILRRFVRFQLGE